MQYFYISEIYRLMGGDGVLVAGKENQYTGENPIGLKDLKGESHEWRKALVAEAISQYDPSLHDILSKTKRPDRKTYVPNGEVDPITGETKYSVQMVPPARIPMKIQKYIIGQKASFARGNGVKLKPSDAESDVFKWVYNNWYANKTDNDLRDIFEKQKAETQCAVIFFADAESIKKAKTAKDPKKVKLKHKLAYPTKGSYLYPYFDPDTESMVAIIREYKGTDGKTIYDCYIEADPSKGRMQPVLRRFSDSDLNTYTETKLPYPKLPVIYWGDDAPACDDTKELIEEMENSFSNFTDQIGYSADPILFAKGTALGMPAKGTAGKFIEGTADAELKYVTPDNATDSRDLHFKMLQKWIFSLNRAVVLDVELMKGLGEVSGAALDRILVDAYLEATDNQTGYWGKGVQRMVNFETAFAKDILGVPDDETTIDVEFTKFRINDLRETVEVMLLANGNKALIDHQESITQAGIADDPAVAYERIKEEQEEDAARGQTTTAEIAQQQAGNPAGQTQQESTVI